MSVHDAVLVLKLTNDMTHEYRVRYITNIQGLNLTFSNLRNIFIRSPICHTLSDATRMAKKINGSKHSRHGIMIINRFRDYEWDDILVGAQREDKVISTKKRI